MTHNRIKVAMAVNYQNQFEAQHFGDADKYLIYEYDENKRLIFIKNHINKNKTIDEEHGSRKKGNAIIDALKNDGVNVLVSRQYGKNIKMVNKHFIPIIISCDMAEEALPVVENNYTLLIKEWQRHSEEYKVFDLRNKHI